MSGQTMDGAGSPRKRSWWHILGGVLLAGTFLLFLIDAYEVYYLTVRDGPQMVYFSMVHAGGPYLLIFLVAVLSFHLHALFAIVVLVLRLFRRIEVLDRQLRLSMTVFAFQAVHFLLQVTYETWSYALFDRAA